MRFEVGEKLAFGGEILDDDFANPVALADVCQLGFDAAGFNQAGLFFGQYRFCLLYTSPSPRDRG